MSLAYMIARSADTIADSNRQSDVDPSQYLHQLSAAISDSRIELPSLDVFCPESEKEKELLERTPYLLTKLHELSSAEKIATQEVLRTLISGMLWDQERFTVPEKVELGGLDDDEFDHYTYLVAGCVGRFWSKICVLSNPSLTTLLEPVNLGIAERFGKALQYVNILRDVPEDQENLRYYLPESSQSHFLEKFLGHSHRAIEYFRSASAYPNLFEPWQLRDKISVFLPLVLGLRTLEKLFLSGPPRPKSRIKVQRAEVLAWLLLSPLVVAVPVVLTKLLNNLACRAENALSQLEKKHETL